MLRCRTIPFCLIVASGLLLCSFSFGAEQSPWLEIHSTHYAVITDAGEKRGREVAFRFEQMRAVFGNLLGKERLNQSVPLTIFAFDNDKSYYQAAPLLHLPGQAQPQPLDVPGVFVPGQDQDFILLNLSEPEPWRAVAHDFAAMLLDFNYPPAQAWFDQGLADYFSSIRLDNREVELGSDPGSSASNSLGSGRASKAFTELLQTQNWMPLPDLFSSKDDKSNPLFAAESWIVMHYLLHEQKLPETGAYFGLVLNQHVPAEDAIQQAYGMSSPQLEQAIKDYFHKQITTKTEPAPQANAGASSTSGLTQRLPSPFAPDDSAIVPKPLPEPDARALYAQVQIRIPERRDVGLKTLQNLATQLTAADKRMEARQARKQNEDSDVLPSNAMGNAVAHRILAWDAIEHGAFPEALNELRDTNALNPSDMWVRYYLSVLKYRSAEAGHTDIQGLPNMMIDLRNVLEWYPEFADAYDLLAMARNAGGGPSAALQAEHTAISLSPRDQRYTLHLAQIYVAGKKWEEANILLDRLQGSSNPQIAEQARDLVEQAGTERKYGIPGKAGDKVQTQLAPQKSPFDVLDEDAAKRAAGDNSPEGSEPGDKRPTKYLKGRLLAVDCSHPPAAVLTVASDSGTLKLRASDYKSLLLIGADDFSCDWRDRRVTINYKAAGANQGDLVSLEMR